MFSVVTQKNGYKKNYTFHYGENIPASIVADDVILVQASDDELAHINKNLPALVPKNLRVVTWYGDMAKLVFQVMRT